MGRRQRTGVPLRRRMLTAIVGVTAVAVVLFAIPLAVAVQRLYRDEATTKLERDATRIAAAAPDDIVNSPVPVRTPVGMSARVTAGIYRTAGQRIEGQGPAWSDVAADGRDGRVHAAVEHGALTVGAPVPSDEGVTAIVVVSQPYDDVTDRTEQTWALMAALALLVVLIAAVFGRRQSMRLARPLEQLTAAAQTLGDGDFSIRAQRSGIFEADAAGQALEVTARRLGDVLDRERTFSADVSHQLKTPLTGLLLGLEAALERPSADLRAAIHTAVGRGEDLHRTIEDLLALARDGAVARRDPLDVAALLRELEERWRGSLGDRLAVRVTEPLPEVRAAAGAVRQILDVLVDNAAKHGAGQITVRAAEVAGGLALEVDDEGPGVADIDGVFARRATADGGHGIGLALARSLAEAEGGRLVVRRAAPPTFSLLLPGADRAQQASG